MLKLEIYFVICFNGFNAPASTENVFYKTFIPHRKKADRTFNENSFHGSVRNFEASLILFFLPSFFVHFSGLFFDKCCIICRLRDMKKFRAAKTFQN